ncbi:hypothetical protein CJD36_021355 [Flavipsychrobacter stenotrophus]|uniref:Four helix bundle protein n=1 Tax=Flavipsychrobacter stenotrophus TaxID=2077091 RepID=A0A2S7SPX8_9BACT|nr:hypothetical protein [Flavipsychrobacter stenotrophus]PQJ08959.1 hypothetical protein CJD36_021355 [Flavipsychrobacter stenotrophus]
MVKEINNMHDVITFIDIIAKEVKELNPFQEFTYDRLARSCSMYSIEEAAIRGQLMDSCFDICSKQNKNFMYLMLVLFTEARNGT